MEGREEEYGQVAYVTYIMSYHLFITMSSDYRYTLIGVNTGLCDEFVPEFFTNLYFHDGLAWIHYIFYTNNNNKCEDFGFVETPGSTTTEKPDHQVSDVLLG